MDSAAVLVSPMCQVPTKVTDDADFVAPLRNHIATVYHEDPDKYAAEISELNTMRTDCRGAGKDMAGRDILYRYYGQLDLLDLRFPIDEKNIRVLFTWYDAFTNKEISQYSIAYEKACVIFNIAATCTSIAANQNRFDATGLKTAFNYFQAAAGLFTYINDNFLHAPSVDLSRDSVKVLSELCLAQAQEVFIEKTLAEKKKGMLVAKLMSHAAHLYQSVAEGLLNESIKGQFDSSWIQMAKAKSNMFEALACYHKSFQLEAEAKYGEYVAYMTKAEQCAKEANSIASQLKSFWSMISNTSGSSSSSSSTNSSSVTVLIEISKQTLTLVTERKTAAVKDNDIIYHENVPTITTLPAIEKLSASKPISFADLCAAGSSASDVAKIVGPDLFAKLIPMSVHEAASVYSEEKATLLRGEQAAVDAANEEMSVCLESMNIVSVLSKLRGVLKGGSSVLGNVDESLGLPDTIRKWCDEIREEESRRGTATDEVLGKLEVLKVKVREILDEVGLMLDREQHECEQLRIKYMNDWTMEPSAKLTSQIRHDIRQNRESFEKAVSTDQTIISRLNECRKETSQMKRPIDQVESIFAELIMAAAPSIKVEQGPSLIDEIPGSDKNGLGALGEQIIVEKLDGMLTRLRSLKTDRATVLNELKAKVHQDDITSVLLLNKNKESSVFPTELAKFKPFQNRLGSNIQSQKKLLSDMSNEFAKLKQTSKTMQVLDRRDKRRNDLIKEWQRAHELWKDAKSGLQRGVSFYTELSDMVQSLRNTVVGFVNRRNDERNSLAKVLEQREAMRGQQALKDEMARLSVSTAPTVPPPMPMSGGSAPSPSYVTSPSQPGSQYPSSMGHNSVPSYPPPPPQSVSSSQQNQPVQLQNSAESHRSVPTTLGQPQSASQQPQYHNIPSQPPAYGGNQQPQPFAPPPPSPVGSTFPGQSTAPPPQLYSQRPPPPTQPQPQHAAPPQSYAAPTSSQSYTAPAPSHSYTPQPPPSGFSSTHNMMQGSHTSNPSYPQNPQNQHPPQAPRPPYSSQPSAYQAPPYSAPAFGGFGQQSAPAPKQPPIPPKVSAGAPYVPPPPQTVNPYARPPVPPQPMSAPVPPQPFYPQQQSTHHISSGYGGQLPRPQMSPPQQNSSSFNPDSRFGQQPSTIYNTAPTPQTQYSGNQNQWNSQQNVNSQAQIGSYRPSPQAAVQAYTGNNNQVTNPSQWNQQPSSNHQPPIQQQPQAPQAWGQHHQPPSQQFQPQQNLSQQPQQHLPQQQQYHQSQAYQPQQQGQWGLQSAPNQSVPPPPQQHQYQPAPPQGQQYAQQQYPPQQGFNQQNPPPPSGGYAPSAGNVLQPTNWRGNGNSLLD